jgi:5-formyltetrahydrofolate cyclo-ligase
MNQKPNLRQSAQAHRAELARACPDFAARIADLALPIPKDAVVSFYWPMGDEADPRALAEALGARGHALALPAVVAKKSPLHFREWRAGDALVVHAFGMHEPPESARRVTPDVLLVPLLAFDAQGTRLGYGGGFYDRTLHSLATKRAIGIAYAGQKMAALPSHDYDHQLDAVLTERGLRRFV